MPEPTPIERAYRMIQSGQTEDARRTLADILKADPQQAMAWALSARLAPDAERCSYALRQVVERSQDNDLAQWAIRQLASVQSAGHMDSGDPPLLGISAAQSDALQQEFRASAQNPRAEPEPAPAPIKLSKPLPTGQRLEPLKLGPGRMIREIGGAIMIGGVLVIVVALLSPTVFDLMARTGILPGWYGIALIVVGGLMIGVGYASGG